MENIGEIERLETKTVYSVTLKQGEWCGLKPGMRVLDAGCGSGKVTAILAELIQPGGEILGIDSSKNRIAFARKQYGNIPGVSFEAHNLLDPPRDIGQFDVIWIRFVLEYFLAESFDIVRNLSECLKPGGVLCLLDLDHN